MVAYSFVCRNTAFGRPWVQFPALKGKKKKANKKLPNMYIL